MLLYIAKNCMLDGVIPIRINNMKTYRIYKGYEKGNAYPIWFAYEVTLFHRLFGPPFGYIGGSCSVSSADDCEAKLKKYLQHQNSFSKIEREITL